MTEDPIQDDHGVYRRVANRKGTWNRAVGKPKNEAFHNPSHGDKPPAVSVDWAERCSPWATQHRATDFRPAGCYVVRLPVGEIRAIDHGSQSVRHQPLDDNPAHSGIIGPKQLKDFILAFPGISENDAGGRAHIVRRDLINMSEVEIEATEEATPIE